MPDTSLDSPQLIVPVPRVVILDSSNLDLAKDILSVQFCSSRAPCKALEVSVNNSFDFRYSGRSQRDDPIHIGSEIGFSIGRFTLARGMVSSLGMSFPGDGPPTLTFSVDKNRILRKYRSNTFTIAYGRGLFEFHPVLNAGHPTINASGVANGTPQLMAGVKLEIFGVGNIYQGTYLVTESTHIYDLTHGYITRFTCTTEFSTHP